MGTASFPWLSDERDIQWDVPKGHCLQYLPYFINTYKKFILYHLYYSTNATKNQGNEYMLKWKVTSKCNSFHNMTDKTVLLAHKVIPINYLWKINLQPWRVLVLIRERRRFAPPRQAHATRPNPVEGGKEKWWRKRSRPLNRLGDLPLSPSHIFRFLTVFYHSMAELCSACANSSFLFIFLLLPFVGKVSPSAKKLKGQCLSLVKHKALPFSSTFFYWGRVLHFAKGNSLNKISYKGV